MGALVTGSSGHLGEALVRSLRTQGAEVIGVDIHPSATTDIVADITDAAAMARCMTGIATVFHAATLHKPHVATHTPHAFVAANITGTLTLLQAASSAKVSAFVYTSTTSVFGDALVPAAGAPAAWITENVAPKPKNIYGVTKSCAEDLCQLQHRNHGLPVIVLRTARFFPEIDDRHDVRTRYEDANAKLNEFTFRRVDLEDVVSAHLLAARQAARLGFARYIISATTPFLPEDAGELRRDARAVLARRVPGFATEYARRGWSMFPVIDRVYVNESARRDLGWRPRYDFAHVLERIHRDQSVLSPLAQRVGAKGYHPGRSFAEGPYPVT